MSCNGEQKNSGQTDYAHGRTAYCNAQVCRAGYTVRTFMECQTDVFPPVGMKLSTDEFSAVHNSVLYNNRKQKERPFWTFWARDL